MEEINKLTTEGININSENLDELGTLAILKVINGEDKTVAFAIEKELTSIEKLVNEAVRVMQFGGRLFYIGAGTSGRLGVLDASECPPTFNTDSSMIQGIIAGGFGALVKSSEGMEDIELQGEEDLIAAGFSNKDILIGIAASGRTPYTIGGLKYAQSIGAKTGSIACNKEAKMSQYANYPIEVLVGPEVLSGSSRMKAGTAQKLILNMITTASMIRLGKVYKGLMVDMKASNEKLQVRAIRMVIQTTDLSEEAAKNLLEASNWHTKTAILMGLTNSGCEESKLLLSENEDNIRKSLNAFFNAHK